MNNLNWAKFWIVWDFSFMIFNIIILILNIVTFKFLNAALSLFCVLIFWFFCSPTHLKEYSKAKEQQ